jgi:putative membrane protein
MNDEIITAPPRVRGERLHPLFLITGLKQVAKNAWGFLAGGAFLAFQNKLGLALMLFGGLVAYTVISLFVKWLTFEYRLDEDELHIDQGLLSRSSRAIPFDRVTDVDIEQGPVHRLLGLARVRLETGASSGSKDEEGVLDTIALDRAEAIREFVRARRRGQVAPEQEHPLADTDIPTVYAMSLKRVFTAGLFNFSLAFLAAIIGVTQTFGDVIGFDPFSRSFWTDLLASTGPLYAFFLAHQVVAIIGGAIVTILMGVGAGIVRTLLADYGFRLDRTDSGFRRRRGLITLTDVSIPRRRVQATMMVTGPVRRAFGWFTLKLQSLAMDGKQGDHVVAPLATHDESMAIQMSLGRPLSPEAGLWHSLPSGHFTSVASGLVFSVVVAVAIGFLLSPFALIAAAALGLAILVRFLEWKRARYALDGDHLFIEDGWWRQRRAIVPIARIQSVDLSENAWTRLFGFCRLKLGIAGGTILSAFQVEALTRSDADALRNRLLTL